MSPKEMARLSANIRPEIKAILEEESANAGLSQTEYLERLIEGTLPNRLEAKIAELLAEIKKISHKP